MLTRNKAQPPTGIDAPLLARWLLEWFARLNGPGALYITQARISDCDFIKLNGVPFTPTVTAGAVTIDLSNGPCRSA
ncbi:hypothetical protein CCP3SC1_2490001 [Gammaproteobacteria bacterium]